MKTQLSQDLRTVFEDTLRPDLISLLRDNLVPLNDRLITSVETAQAANHDRISSTLFEHYRGLASDIQWIKHQIGTPSLFKDPNGSALVGGRIMPKVPAALEDSKAASDENDTPESGETLQEMQVNM